MIKKLEIKKYRKLNNIELDFKEGINIISGTNGTCKTSILHLISNSFQAVNSKMQWLNDKKSIEVIKKINKISNPKVETLTRGDEKYNDPAVGVVGELFKSVYFDNSELKFRRHNSTIKDKHRFSIKPRYSDNKKESLIPLPIIYLGLFRLFAYGEFSEDEAIKNIGTKIPDKYLLEIKELYKDFTGVEINYETQHDMGGIKTRAKFKSNQPGIDSNTISAGEDNLFIILTALVSLKYYFESITSAKEIESILLIDEIDATLHPAFQIKLLDLFKVFSKEYKIQIFFTTHSLSLLDYALLKKENVIYLLDNIHNIKIMEDVDKYKIEMYLRNKTKSDIFLPKKIPLFTEDAEARCFLVKLFEKFSGNQDLDFKNVVSLFHFVEANLSSQALKDIFKDDQLLRSTMRSIAILDGDQDKINMTNHLIKLPGNKSPEFQMFDYVEELFLSKDDTFWDNEYLSWEGLTRTYYRDYIKKDIDSIENEIHLKKLNGETTKGIKREKSKECFKKYEIFFKCAIVDWINNDKNKVEIDKFYNNLKGLFKKVAEFHGINPSLWNK